MTADWDPDAEQDDGRQMLDQLAAVCGLPPIIELRQTGRDVATARLTLAFATGVDLHMSPADMLSKARMEAALAITCGVALPPDLKSAQWRTIATRLIADHAQITDVDDEPYSVTVEEWVGQHTAQAREVGEDRAELEACARSSMPFMRDGDMHVSVSGLARWVRREYGETPPASGLRLALRDLGWENCRITYTSGRKGAGLRRQSSASYYRQTSQNPR